MVEYLPLYFFADGRGHTKATKQMIMGPQKFLHIRLEAASRKTIIGTFGLLLLIVPTLFGPKQNVLLT